MIVSKNWADANKPIVAMGYFADYVWPEFKKLNPKLKFMPAYKRWVKQLSGHPCPECGRAAG